ncbi:MAG: 3'-5' exonuclease [Aquabacterium sp.]|uniref:3'-5' exonuclease n=1 Tax=Aquabacterium sp. TaxID=1872578 RepID=UPI002727D042|nr:3'-5' exonuclease [Aquabacterium sp.]MDO9005038.1 3'-5' exonuclease [Aquabacterium sp.]
MALFPQGLSHVDKRCNPGERRVLNQIKRCLEDDYLVWHDIPVGPKALQPDFVILSPRWGVLLLEVKDWKRSTLASATKDRVELTLDRGLVTDANPLRKVRDYAMELVNLMQMDAQLIHPAGPFQGKLLFPYGWGLAFSNMKRADVGDDFGEVFPEHKTLLRDDLDEAMDPGVFQQRLWGMFSVSYPHTLSLPQRDRVRWHLFPEVRMVPAQASLTADGDDAGASALAPLPDLMQVMDLQQERIARTLGEGHRVIHGAAGSGKTMILIFRAQQLAAAAQPGRPILVLCYNRALAGRIDAVLRKRGVDEQRVQVRTFHAWCEDMVRTYQVNVPADRRQSPHYYEVLAQSVDRALATGLIPSGQYLALLIDEAHDFEEAWLRLSTKLIDPSTNSLLVLYDDAQSIYQKKRRSKFTFASVGINAQRRRTQILRLNYRNTTEILNLAVRCAQTLLQEGLDDSDTATVMPASAGRAGPMPVLIEAKSPNEEAELVAHRIATLVADGQELDEIAVLCRTRYQMAPLERALSKHRVAFQSMNADGFRRFDWRRPSVKLVTLHSAKGLEFTSVFILALQTLPYKGEALDDEVRLLYVGMTRANRDLVLSASGRSVIVDRVKSALDAVC